MWKSIIYKEWLKVRWIWLIVTVIGLMVAVNIYMRVSHDILFTEANNYWYGILFQGFQYFKFLKYIPLLGLVFAIAQYFPETVNKRIKLTFHLPVKENKALLVMMLFGTVCLFITYLIIFLTFYVTSTIYLPAEIIGAAVISIIPWILAGFVVYYFVSLIVMEPIWYFWIFYAAVGFFFVRIFIEFSVAGGYAPINLLLLIITVLLSISMLFSAYRFRKGEM